MLPGLVSRIHQVLNVVVGGDGQLGQVFHVGSQQRVLSDPQVPLVFGVQQVAHALTVDLHVTHLRTEEKVVTEEHSLVNDLIFKS